MRKHILVSAVVALSLGLAACADKPNANLQKAESDFLSLQNNPKSSQWASAETIAASAARDTADKAYRNGESEAVVDQKAYLLQRNVDFANATIALRQAEETQRVKAKVLDIAKQTARGEVVTFGDVLFEVGKANVNPAAYANLDKLATYLKQNPERKVLIEGFTDSTGSDQLNLRLSQARADAVARQLTNRGVAYDRITTHGYGKEFPVASNANATDRALNRRVEVTISNDSKPVAPRL